MTNFDELAALAKKATPGPWDIIDSDKEINIFGGWDDTARVVCARFKGNNTDNDFAFIAACRTAVPELLSRVTCLEAAINKALSYVEHSEYMPGSRIDMCIRELKALKNGV